MNHAVIDTRERVEERALELILDPLRSVAVAVEELALAGIEHEPANHQVDAGESHPVRDAVEDRSASDDREFPIGTCDGHPTNPLRR